MRHVTLLGCVVVAYASFTSLVACESDSPGTSPSGASGGGGSSGQPSASGGTGSGTGGASRGGGTGGNSVVSSDAGAGACEALTAVCRRVDPGSGAIHACVTLGAAADESACAAGFGACETSCGATVCTRLGNLCHPVDPGSGPLHECHDLGHAGVAKACFEGGADCFRRCDAAARDAGLTEPKDSGKPFDANIPFDSGPVEAGPKSTCAVIAEACAHIDPGVGRIHDCVLLGSADSGTCNDRLASCRSLCGASLCVTLGNVCHDVDPGTGPLHECHEIGHSGNAPECFDDAVACLSLCAAAAAL